MPLHCLSAEAERRRDGGDQKAQKFVEALKNLAVFEHSEFVKFRPTL
jgi:hypothetical protein